MIRDVLSARVPRALHEDFYATTALVGTTIMVVLLTRFWFRKGVAGAVAGVAIFALQTAALLGE